MLPAGQSSKFRTFTVMCVYFCFQPLHLYEAINWEPVMYTSLSFLPQDRNWTLEELNREQVNLLIPSLVYTSFLMIIGVIGNVSVLFIYSRKFKSSNHRCFILTLGIFDTIMCIVGMPFLIVDMMYPLMFYNIQACKVLRFLNYYLSLVSINTLFLIALERYRKICQPLKRQLNVTSARTCILVIVFVIGPIMSIPSLFIYGHNTMDTGVNHIQGVQCFTDDSVKNTLFPVVYNVILLFICSVYAMGIGLCYIQIARQRLGRARQHASKAALLKTTPPTSSTNNSDVTFNMSTTLGDAQSCPDVKGNVHFTLGDESSREAESNTSSCDPNGNIEDNKEVRTPLNGHCRRKDTKVHFIKRCETASAKIRDWRERKTNRITKILFIITMVFTLSVTPHLIVMITIFLKDDFLASMGPIPASIYQIGLRSFLINSVANPIIYGCIDKKFRKEFGKCFTYTE